MIKLFQAVVFVLAVFLIVNADEAISGDDVSVGAEHQEAGMSASAPAHGKAGLKVVARVNGTDIRLSDLVRKMRQITLKNYRRRELTPEISQQIRSKALNRLVVEELAYQRAMALGISVGENEINQRIEELKQGSGGENHLKAFLAMQNLDMPGLKKEIGRYLAVKHAIEKEVYENINIPEDAIDAAYEKMKDEFVQPERVVVIDVVFFLDSSDRGAVEKAEEVRRKIVEELENDPTRLSPDGTFIVRGNLKLKEETDGKLYEIAKTLQDGEVSKVVVADETLHILKLLTYRPRRVKSREEVRPYLAGRIRQERKQEALDKWKAGLMEGAKIETFDFTAGDARP